MRRAGFRRHVADPILVVYAIGLPAIGTLAAVVGAWTSWSSATRGMAAAEKRQWIGRFLVFLQLPFFMILFGLVLFVLFLGRAGRPSGQTEWAALAYGISGMLTGFAFAIVFRGGVAHSIAVSRDFGRVLVLATLPETVALFGFSLAFLILGQSAPDDPISIGVVVEASRTAALWMIAGSFVAPVEAYAMVAYWRFESLKRWTRAIVIGALLKVPLVIAYALAFLALGPL